MARRGPNMNNSSSGHYGGAKKPTNNMNNMNRNRSSFGGKSSSFGGGSSNFGGSSSNFGGGSSNFGGGSSNFGGGGNSYGSGMNKFGGGMAHPVNPWLSQPSSSPMNPFGRSVASDQQAQLALASTLLNNLLKPASQLSNKSSAAPPSLLSLNRATQNPSSSYGPPPNNFSRDRFNFGRPNTGKVQKDYRKGDFKNKRFGDRKNKKPNQPNRQANNVVAKKAAEKKDEKAEIQVETMDVDQSTSEKNNTETVVKTEPSTTTTTTTTTTAEPKTPTKEPSTPKKEPKKEAGTPTKKSKKDEPKASYAGIPSALLFCHICRKHMWDDASFEKHLEGKPHKMMVQELDVSYGLKVDLLRHEMRVSEQQRENDIQRAHRKGKVNKSQQRDFCNMCNLSFLGMLPAHRKNERHQRLKKFLHPKCNVCSKEFYTRLEWDDHKLTPAHLKKLAEIRKETRPDLEDSEFDIIDFIEDIDEEFEMENIELKVVGQRESLDDLQTEKGEAATNGDETAKEQTSEEKQEDEEFKKLPKYTPGIPVGEHFMIEKTGSLCRVCNKFCLTSEDTKTHCQSVAHYNNVIKIMKAQNKIVRKRRLNDLKTEDNAAETVQEDAIKKSRTENVSPNSTETNGLATQEQPVEEKSGADVYDPENPGSENEKDAEAENATTEQKDTDMKPDIAEISAKMDDSDATKTTTEETSPAEEPNPSEADVKKEAVETAPEPVVEESPTKTRRTRGQNVAVRGAPRARRGRRH